MLSEEQAIEKLKKIRQDTITANECGLSNNDFKEEIEAYDAVLNIIDRLQKENEEKDKEIRNLKDEINDAWGEWNDLEQTAYEEETRLKTELEKKDKIINLMAEAFKQDDARSVEEIIEYFENKVKENEDEI